MMEVRTTPDTSITALYKNNNQTVAPFAIDKTFSKGRIVLINAGAYFDTISGAPRQYFGSLLNISQLLSLDRDKSMHESIKTKNEFTALPMRGITGNLETTGKITLNSSSLSVLAEDTFPYLLKAKRIAIFNETNHLPVNLSNIIIKGFRLTGDYSVFVNQTGKLKLPGMMSDHNYISMFLTRFNMTVLLHPEGHTSMEIRSLNNTFGDSIKVNNNSRVEFYDVKAGPSLKYIPILLKSPEILADGNTSIKNANFDGYLNREGAIEDGMKLELQGKSENKICLCRPLQ